MHDTGMANSFLILQAQSMGIHGHFMAGIDKAKLAELLQLSPVEEAVCGIALATRTMPSSSMSPIAAVS